MRPPSEEETCRQISVHSCVVMFVKSVGKIYSSKYRKDKYSKQNKCEH